MGLITKLKSLLGLGEDQSQTRRSDAGVTIEREPGEVSEEPAAPSERAVTEAGERSEPDTSTEPAAEETEPEPAEEGTEPDEGKATSGASTEEIVDEPTDHIEEAEPDAPAEPETADEPGEATGPEPEDAVPEQTEETEPEPGPEETTEGRPLEDVKGIGPAYADRLRDAGVDDTAQLANADHEDLASEIDVSPKRVEGWVERAKSM